MVYFFCILDGGHRIAYQAIALFALMMAFFILSTSSLMNQLGCSFLLIQKKKEDFLSITWSQYVWWQLKIPTSIEALDLLSHLN